MTKFPAAVHDIGTIVFVRLGNGTAHNALDDARTQAVHLMACMYEGREA